MKKYKIGNSLWSFNSEKDMFSSIEKSWKYLSVEFAKSRTSDPNKSFKAYLYVYQKNTNGFYEWQICKEGFARII